MATKLRVIRASPWAYQRIAEECGKRQQSFWEALDLLIKELDGLKAEMKPRLLQDDGRVAALAQSQPKLPAYALEVRDDGSFRCKKCGRWHARGCTCKDYS